MPTGGEFDNDRHSPPFFYHDAALNALKNPIKSDGATRLILLLRQSEKYFNLIRKFRSVDFENQHIDTHEWQKIIDA
ncbi:MAG: hypothetical protein PVI90_16270, partial [Desulfobacteraceae bacterium]